MFFHIIPPACVKESISCASQTKIKCLVPGMRANSHQLHSTFEATGFNQIPHDAPEAIKRLFSSINRIDTCKGRRRICSNIQIIVSRRLVAKQAEKAGCITMFPPPIINPKLSLSRPAKNSNYEMPPWECFWQKALLNAHASYSMPIPDLFVGLSTLFYRAGRGYRMTQFFQRRAVCEGCHRKTRVILKYLS